MSNVVWTICNNRSQKCHIELLSYIFCCHYNRKSNVNSVFEYSRDYVPEAKFMIKGFEVEL